MNDFKFYNDFMDEFPYKEHPFKESVFSERTLEAQAIFNYLKDLDGETKSFFNLSFFEESDQPYFTLYSSDFLIKYALPEDPKH